MRAFVRLCKSMKCSVLPIIHDISVQSTSARTAVADGDDEGYGYNVHIDREREREKEYNVCNRNVYAIAV